MKSLALKYRPQKFEDVSGQEYILKSLKNIIETGLTSQAYLFSGSRGVGKTSIARIVARSLNCEKGQTSAPCNECGNCSDIFQGNSPDVIEMDAASHRGIQYIRELRDNAKFSPMKSRYKIYIIDEAHMLTFESFNALLKTLEEPPSHVIFILATTEKHKIPETILSRCQSFSFKKFTHEQIIDRLKVIISREDIAFEESGLFPIAQKADGSLRDAITCLDQVLAYSASKNLACSEVQLILGMLPFETICQALSYIRGDSISDLLLLIEKIHEEGYQLKGFLWNLLDILKSGYLIKLKNFSEKGRLFSESQFETLTKEFDLWDQEMLQQTFHSFYAVYSNPLIFHDSSSNEIRISLEMAIVSLLQKLKQPSVAGLTRKIIQLKNAIEKGEKFQDSSTETHLRKSNSNRVDTPAHSPILNTQEKTKYGDTTRQQNDQQTNQLDIESVIQTEFMGQQDNSKDIVNLFDHI